MWPTVCLRKETLKSLSNMIYITENRTPRQTIIANEKEKYTAVL